MVTNLSYQDRRSIGAITYAVIMRTTLREKIHV